MIFIKHVRNKIKSGYSKRDTCYICNSTIKLEFHHLICLSVLAKKLLLKQGYRDYPKDDDPRFEELVWYIANNGQVKDPEFFYTLCKECHKGLHKKFGQTYYSWKPVEKYIDKIKGQI